MTQGMSLGEHLLKWLGIESAVAGACYIALIIDHRGKNPHERVEIIYDFDARRLGELPKREFTLVEKLGTQEYDDGDRDTTT